MRKRLALRSISAEERASVKSQGVSLLSVVGPPSIKKMQREGALFRYLVSGF